MTADDEFEDLWKKLRIGDELAAETLVRNFETEIRRYVRFRLTNPALKRVVDSLDICQSVFGRFFVQVSKGAVELENPQQLRALLLTMARNRLYDEARHEHAERRDARRLNTDDAALERVDDGTDSPSKAVATEELLNMVRAQLSEEEQYLINQKLSGRQWAELANEFGSSAEALRKRTERALDRAALSLGLFEESHGKA